MAKLQIKILLANPTRFNFFLRLGVYVSMEWQGFFQKKSLSTTLKSTKFFINDKIIFSWWILSIFFFFD